MFAVTLPTKCGMLPILALLLLLDTTVVTTKLCRVETRADLRRLHSRGRLVVGDTAVLAPGLAPAPIDGYVGAGGYTSGPGQGSVPLEFEWRLAGDTVACGQSRIYARRRSNRFTTYDATGEVRCRIDIAFCGQTIIFVRFKTHTDLYIE